MIVNTIVILVVVLFFCLIYLPCINNKDDNDDDGLFREGGLYDRGEGLNRRISRACWGIMGNQGKRAAKYSICITYGNPVSNKFGKI